MRHHDQTAILFFSRTPQEEARHKRLVSRRKTADITTILRRQSLREAEALGLPVFHSTAKCQQGACFGERLANAIESTFAKGYDRLLIIGNDTPDLDASGLQDAQRLLADDQLILGPSLDGGVYLIGLTLASYQRNAFIQLAWETEELQANFVAYAEAHALNVHSLVPLADIDTTADFWQFFNSLSPENIWRSVYVKLLQHHISSSYEYETIPLPLIAVLDCRALRAPPC
ncbi:MAG: DUF2064 domain-containing protein [Bacteroidota bacterium]